jgi:hypothetical protein
MKRDLWLCIIATVLTVVIIIAVTYLQAHGVSTGFGIAP